MYVISLLSLPALSPANAPIVVTRTRSLITIVGCTYTNLFSQISYIVTNGFGV